MLKAKPLTECKGDGQSSAESLDGRASDETLSLGESPLLATDGGLGQQLSSLFFEWSGMQLLSWPAQLLYGRATCVLFMPTLQRAQPDGRRRVAQCNRQ
jgi:hypothetical protein